MAQRTGKWIDRLRPDMQVSAAARKTLRRRLAGAWKKLRAASLRAAESPEHVHQLRVATRRALAALEGYVELAPRRRAEKMNKQLNRMRRVAGDARDFDVLSGRLRGRADAERFKPLIDEISRLRCEAQQPIDKLYRKLAKQDFPREVKKLVKKVRGSRVGHEATYLQWARLGLSRAVETFFVDGSADFDDLERLHAFRIDGKHLRYAIEHFGAAFGPQLRDELYPLVEQVQGLLGAVNDHASALAHFETWRSEWTDPTLTTLLDERIAAETEALTTARAEFTNWWTPQRATELRNQFATLLQRPDEEHAA